MGIADEAREAHRRAGQRVVSYVRDDPAVAKAVIAAAHKATDDEGLRPSLAALHKADPPLSLTVEWLADAVLLHYPNDDLELFAHIAGSEDEPRVSLYVTGDCHRCSRRTVLGPAVESLPQIGAVLTAGTPVEGHPCPA